VWFGETVGSMHDVTAKSLGEFIDCHVKDVAELKC
jgi:hypothetical protein